MTTASCCGGSCATAEPATLGLLAPRAFDDDAARIQAELTARLEQARAELAALEDTDPDVIAARFADPDRHTDAAQAIEDFLDALGVPLEPGHSDDTPRRVAKAFRELLAGYAEDPRVHLHKQFPGPSDAGVVAVQGVRFTSLCAHHLLPFAGRATVAYLPGAGEPIVGLSKLARVLEGYARRMQTQEVLGSQVVDAIEEVLAPLGAACIITSHHNCMGIRGVKQQDAVMTTSSLRGLFREDAAARAELMALHHAS